MRREGGVRMLVLKKEDAVLFIGYKILNLK